jgi:hypothetical protein
MTTRGGIGMIGSSVGDSKGTPDDSLVPGR